MRKDNVLTAATPLVANNQNPNKASYFMCCQVMKCLGDACPGATAGVIVGGIFPPFCCAVATAAGCPCISSLTFSSMQPYIIAGASSLGIVGGVGSAVKECCAREEAADEPGVTPMV